MSCRGGTKHGRHLTLALTGNKRVTRIHQARRSIISSTNLDSREICRTSCSIRSFIVEFSSKSRVTMLGKAARQCSYPLEARPDIRQFPADEQGYGAARHFVELCLTVTHVYS